MELLANYEKAEQELFDYFGYVEDWRCIPFDFATEMHWKLTEDSVLYSEERSDAEEETGDHYSNEIYRQRHLPKWVYPGKDYTMIVVDTHVDGNQFLQVFKNSLEIK